LIYISVFLFGIAIFLGVIAVYKNVNGKSKFLKNRMKGKIYKDKGNDYEELFKDNKKLTYKEKIEKNITRSGLELKFQEYIYAMIGSIFFLFTISLVVFHGRIFPSICVSIFGYFLPNFYLKRKYKKRLKKFNNQLVDTLRTLTSSLRGGLSLEQSIHNLAKSSPSPTKEEFTKVSTDLSYGKGFEESMKGLQNRINDSDMDLILTVILIQKDIGGDLTKSLDTIADTIEERIKLKNDLKALTANGKLSALIIGNVPVVMFAALNLVDPTYFSSFFKHPIGIILFGLALFLDILGVLLSIKLATPEISEI